MNVSKYTKGFKASFTFISLGILLGITSIAAIANAQVEEAADRSGSGMNAEVVRPATGSPATAGQPTSTDERRETRQEQAAERRAALQVRAQERITNLAANMSNRMESAITRLQNVIDRLESRIEKLSEAGVLTADAAATLESAEVELQRARETLSDIDAQVAAMVGSETPRSAWQSLRETYTTARDAILLSHQGLRNTLAILKQAVAAAEVGEGVSDAVDNATTSAAASSE